MPSFLLKYSAEIRLGLITGVIAYTLWGLLPLYLKSVQAAPAAEILAHRILWSVPFGAILIAARKQWGEVGTALRDKHVLLMLTVSALTISTNWLLYVWAVLQDQIMQASLGYFINPLMYVAAGVFVMGEKLRAVQIVAVALATIGVLVLTIGGGIFPWISLVLATQFTAYGYIRKTTSVGAMPGLFIETLMLAPLALGYLIWAAQAGRLVFGQNGYGFDALLVLAGPVTVVPLVLFAISARRLKLSTIGLLQYIGPTLQFIISLFYGEPFTLYHAICFGLIWLALAIFSADALRQNGRAAT